MGVKDKRTVMTLGIYSRAISIPAKIKVGKTVTLAANRLILIDSRGEIDEDDLLQFLEDVIEPQFWPWLKERQNMKPTLNVNGEVEVTQLNFRKSSRHPKRLEQKPRFIIEKTSH